MCVAFYILHYTLSSRYLALFLLKRSSGTRQGQPDTEMGIELELCVDEALGLDSHLLPQMAIHFLEKGHQLLDDQLL